MGQTYYIYRALGFMVPATDAVNKNIVRLYKEHVHDCDDCDDYQWMMHEIIRILEPSLVGDYFYKDCTTYDTEAYVSVSVDLSGIVRDDTYYQQECFITDLPKLQQLLSDNESKIRRVATALGLPEDISLGFSYKFAIN